MRALILLHRWLGVAFCLLFTMWFFSGVVMHFVPFPAFSETERVGGLVTLDLAGLTHGPADAVAAAAIKEVTRLRLLQRPDGPVYVVTGRSGVAALRAPDLANAAVGSRALALAIAADYAGRRHLDPSRASVAALARYDQWTVSGQFDRHRPLYRIALNDGLGTEIYVSSATGEVVLGTTRHQRAWNYVGSIAHWIYPTALRSHPAAWTLLLWWLSLLATVGAALGAVIGTLRISVASLRPTPPYGGWQAWHHRLGLICALFVLTWICSGWLSMDDGRLFSTGMATDAEATAIAGAPAWQALQSDEMRRISAQPVEVEWFALGGRIYRRERHGIDRQQLMLAGADNGAPQRAFLQTDEIDSAVNRLQRACGPAFAIGAADNYAVAPGLAGGPLFRAICGDDWFDFDGASGALVGRLDASRRLYRWLYQAPHTLDFPALRSRPALRTTLIVILCGCGFAFSLTGVVIAGRRLLSLVG